MSLSDLECGGTTVSCQLPLELESKERPLVCYGRSLHPEWLTDLFSASVTSSERQTGGTCFLNHVQETVTLMQAYSFFPLCVSCDV